jgi:hypothetical protein
MSMTKRHSLFSLILAVVLGSSAGLSPARAQSSDAGLPSEWSNVRKTLEKYQDVVVALRDGYFSGVLCIKDDTGAGMGIHFVNRALMGPVADPMRPQILLYEPVGDKFELVGAEWFIPLATGVNGVPSLFGQPFDGPMEGHPPTQPASLHHYDLHVWLFKPNPAGLFKPFNVNLKCPNTDYTHMAEPAKIVPHH